MKADFTALEQTQFDGYELSAGRCAAKEAESFTISGQWQSDHPKYYKMQVKSCRDNPSYTTDAMVNANCKSANDITAALDYIVINLYIVNHYFDDTDFAGEDVHAFMDYYYYPLQKGSAQAKVFYLSLNEVTKFDGLIGIEPNVTDTFYEIFPYYSYSRASYLALDGQDPWLFTCWFSESMNKKIITRKVTSVLDTLAEVGGLVNILLLVVAVLIGWFQRFLFEAHMASEIFLEYSTEYYSRK